MLDFDVSSLPGLIRVQAWEARNIKDHKLCWTLSFAELVSKQKPTYTVLSIQFHLEILACMPYANITALKLDFKLEEWRLYSIAML